MIIYNVFYIICQSVVIYNPSIMYISIIINPDLLGQDNVTEALTKPENEKQAGRGRAAG